MKRDWDLIRDLLLAAEAKAQGEKLLDKEVVGYDLGDVRGHIDLLQRDGYIDARVLRAGGGSQAIVIAQVLSVTLSGFDLLDTLRSKPVWERIKKTAQDKGIELTFDAVKMLGKAALAAVIGA
jgi:Hypothetical protein (DUF2513).